MLDINNLITSYLLKVFMIATFQETERAEERGLLGETSSALIVVSVILNCMHHASVTI